MEIPNKTSVTFVTNGALEINDITFTGVATREITSITTGAAATQEISSVNPLSQLQHKKLAQSQILTRLLERSLRLETIAAATQEATSIATIAAATQEVTSINAIAIATQEVTSINTLAIATQEVTDLNLVSASDITSGQYFTISSASTDFYVWFNKDGAGGDPAPGGKTGISVAIVGTDTADQVATKVR